MAQHSSRSIKMAVQIILQIVKLASIEMILLHTFQQLIIFIEAIDSICEIENENEDQSLKLLIKRKLRAEF